MRQRTLSLAIACCLATPVYGEILDNLSVTATRDERPTSEVAQAIAVVNQEQLESRKMMNLQDALSGVPGVLIDSKNGGYDSRLIIRGAGLSAAYGIREIMILRDGVPQTDPDSFTRLDFLDLDDIKQVEVTKGPGSPYAPGVAGGTIQIVSKSAFDTGNNVTIAGGEQGSRKLSTRYQNQVGNQAFAVQFSHRAMDNSWRGWNQSDTTSFTMKHGMELNAKETWESELSYTEANAQLPGGLNAAAFEQFKNTGKQTYTTDAWKNSGRYSKIWAANTKLDLAFGEWNVKPKLYATLWKHFHPVTGLINESGDWNTTVGADVDGTRKHTLAGLPASLVLSATIKQQRAPEANKYQYRDVTTIAGGRISSTLSDEIGTLAQKSSSEALLYGFYAGENIQLSQNWQLDGGARFDKMNMKSNWQNFSKYDYATGKYVTDTSSGSYDRSYDFFSPHLGVIYKVMPGVNAYAQVAAADQTPADSQLSTNQNLTPSRVTNYEVGTKVRKEGWQMDVAAYIAPVENDIIQVRDGSYTTYANAGKTERKGVEVSTAVELTNRWQVGGGVSVTDYRFKSFTEVVSAQNISRAGNKVSYIPELQYNLFTGYKQGNWKARLQLDTWGEYWIDNANSSKYQGYTLLPRLMVGWDSKPHSITLNLDNVTDMRYAMSVTNSSSGASYTPGAPRIAMLTYRYAF
ncbi:MAG: TonB-dependent receptor [Thiotrichales bacterium]|jgi:iron complex outermembrane receptor protein|nr:TonB-dependent receptor [Thiotrichales bacterium]